MESKLSKEQIINQAFKYHSQGNILEASKYYQYFINQGFKDCRVFSNYGVILRNMGKLKEAEVLYRKSIELNPDFADAYSNLGNIQRDLGKLKEAELSCRKAIQLNSNYANAYSSLGTILRDLGKLQEAELSYRKAIQLNPNYAEAYSNLGNILGDLGKLQEAELSYRKATQLNPNLAEAYFNLGTILKDLGRLQEAELSYRKAIQLNPNFAVAYSNLGTILKDLGKLQEAEFSYRKAIEIIPNFADAYSNLGSILFDLGKLKEAELSTRKAIEINPNYAHAYSNLGSILFDLGKLKEAELSSRKAIEINPDYAYAHFNLGVILRNLGKLQEAEISYRKSIELNPNFANAYSNLGNILRDLGKLQEAELSYRKAIQLNPNYANAYSNLGGILKDLCKLKEAELYTRKAIEINADYADAHFNLGGILKDLGKLKDAELSTRKAIEINPDFAEAYSNLGSIFFVLGKLKDAELSTRKAIEINPDFVDAHFNLGTILSEIDNFFDAINQYKKALKLDNELSIAKAKLIETKGIICDWSDEETHNIWLKSIGIKGKSISPWVLYPLEDNPIKHLKISKKFYKQNYPQPTKHFKYSKKNIIHIGYFSADFRAHPVMLLMARILELHDKSRFKIYLYSFVSKEDEYTERAKKSGCIFRNITKLNHIESVELARRDKLDIAIDLMGYTKNNRMSIFSYRVAPIQINYLGFPGSVGADTIDYIIADNIIIPKENEKYYSEKIIRMPNCILCCDNKKEISNESLSRRDFNLPDKGFIFTCFNANYKITKKEFDIWMSLLLKIEGSVLWLYKSNQLSKNNLCKEARKRKVDPNRLIFANKLPLDKHLARHSLGDLALDTFNYNGGSTTSTALLGGLPVLTKIGQSFMARVSASLLTSIGLPELITYSEIEYEEKAFHIAQNPNELISLKSKLARLKDKSPLNNSELFTRDLETKYIELVNSDSF